MNPLEASTIRNHLKLFDENGEPVVERVTDFLSISRNELAKAFGLSGDQIRPERMSNIAKTRVRELAGTLEFVAEIFSGKKAKALFWINAPNPNFGGISPRDMILRGRERKVSAFVLAAMGRESGRVA